MTAYRRLLDALSRLDKRVDETRPEHDAMVQCPAHPDNRPSLHVMYNHGQVLLYCHAGCSTEAILEPLGWTMAYLFDDADGTRYDYLDRDGTVSRSVYRSPSKRFRQAGDMKRTILFQLPRVLSAVSRGEPIFLTEGEKDALLIEDQGCTATTAPQGAQNFARVDVSPLLGAQVIAIVDRDKSGQAWAHRVHTALAGLATVKFVQAKTGKDAADHIMAGHKLSDLEPVELEPVNGVERPPRLLRLTSTATIKPQPVTWLWEHDEAGRIPANALSIFAGREGTGKSSFVAWLTARITTGTLPGAYYGRPRSVYYVSIEESWAQALVPKLMASGADLARVHLVDVLLDTDEETMLSLPTDNEQLEAILATEGAVLVIDPLMSVMGSRIDTHRERDVRLALDPLSRMADRAQATILGVAHFNKSSGTDAANLITGSGAFKNVARAVFGFANDDDSEDRVMSQVKNSLGPGDLSLSYYLESQLINTDSGPAETVRFKINGASERHVAQLLSNANSGADDEDRNEAQEFLIDFLIGEGGEATAGDVIKAARPAGFSESQIKHARRRARSPEVRSRKQGQPGERGVWVWAIDTDGPEGATVPEGATKVPKVPRDGPLAPSAPSAAPSAACRACRFPLSATATAEGFSTHASCDEGSSGDDTA